MREMNRRDFLKALVAVGATTAVAARMAELACSEFSVPSVVTLPALGDIFWIERVLIYGLEAVQRPAFLGLTRVGADVPLWRVAFNAMGGSVYWALRPGEEIVVPKQFPVAIDAAFDGAVSIEGHVGNASAFHRFVTRRSGLVVSEQSVLLEREPFKALAWEESPS